MSTPMEPRLSAQELKQKTKQIVSEISRIDVREFEDDVVIREELGIDSLMAMEIIATCEKRFHIQIDEAQFADIETVGDFLDFLAELYRDTHGQR